jgi:hypothetical protein
VKDHNDHDLLHFLREWREEIKHQHHQIMSQITDWAAQEQADLASISTTLDGIVTGIAALDALITSLQTSPGTLSAADQAALDSIQAASKALVAKSGAIVVTPPVAAAPAAKPA